MNSNLKKVIITMTISLALILPILWALITKFSPPPYAFHENTLLVAKIITGLCILLTFIIAIMFNGWRSLFKNFFAYLGLILVIMLLVNMSLYYLALVSLTLSKSEVTTVELVDRKYGSRGGCRKWTVKYVDGTQTMPFCQNQQAFDDVNLKSQINVKLTRSWLVDEIEYIALNNKP